MGAETIESHAAGYRLSRTVCQLDVDRFDQLVDGARRQMADDQVEEALGSLDTALAMVRGRSIAQVADEWWAMAAAHELTERIALAEELWADIRLRSDKAGRELGRMHQAARSEPQRELRWRQVMQGLAAAGRRTEALRVADEAKRALAEFGLLPGPEILALEIELLGSPTDDTGPITITNRLTAMSHQPFVGRHRLLTEMSQASGVVWLDGEPGIGKTRLLAEVAAVAARRGELVLYGACERSAAAGTQLIVDIANAAMQAASAPPRIPVELAALLGHADTDADTDSSNAHLDPAVRRARIRSGVVGLLSTVAAERAVLVMADDVHWIDDEAVDVVMHLVQ
ncbi:MAG: hypothetical protein JWN99_365, partial [Ilumatobacteraceae bacterium]|nr:hypothetical protein [Ilumatobacteraceae bacterium]